MTTIAESSLDRLTALDPAFARMVAATTRHLRAVPELTEREKVFLCVVADVCQPSLGLPFEAHVRAGLAAGVSVVDIHTLLRFVSYDTGYPAAAAGFERLVELEEALGLPRPEGPLPAEDLLVPGPSPMPASAQAQLAELDPHFAEYFSLQSRMRADAGFAGLSERERAFATMSVDVHYQTLGETFAIHVGRALRAGASPDDVRAVLRFNAQFGATRAWQGWKALNPLLAG
ncbi:carboxymuconolactone decarboxylase family protein [Amycolatopsis saalfeldensis]|uniref:Carboxymuconolactone decarboxylase family protein n=1 Tax=Amycolatopsis saalfeldensis TaxID=394193 RepID=A0A1H8YI95_9PSEU|nr:carboxymuconolactone decarboxylase family protein [Amycolatopsis saalfeldensis]SEP51772.1 Carboxymuconolactone decarboxylase family protein [Amycolatopsis saalfeldensis]